MTRDTTWRLWIRIAVGVGLAVVMIRVPGDLGVPERVVLWVLLTGFAVFKLRNRDRA